MVLGAASEDRLFGVVEARRAADGVTVTTDDGSAGQPRLGVATCCRDIIDRTGAGVVYGCGPMAMLRSITDIAEADGAVAQVAVEESMACGVGVCMTCVMPVVGNDGLTRMVRSCVEGPVFRGDRVRWDAFGTSWSRARRRRRRPAGRRPLMSPPRRDGDPRPEPPGGAGGRHERRRSAAPVLPNPLMTASGCAANGKELHRFFDVAELGAFVTKSVMADPRSGRGTPRMAETPSGMLNSIGLQGPGIDGLRRQRPGLAEVRSAPGRWSRSPAARSGEFADVAATLRRAGPSTPWSGSRSTSPAPTSPTAGWSSRATRWPRPRSSRSCASSCRATSRSSPS